MIAEELREALVKADASQEQFERELNTQPRRRVMAPLALAVLAAGALAAIVVWVLR